MENPAKHHISVAALVCIQGDLILSRAEGGACPELFALFQEREHDRARALAVRSDFAE